MARFIPQGMGWIPDLPDPRDYAIQHESVQSVLHRLAPAPRTELPGQVVLFDEEEGQYFSPAEDQGPINSSTAFAVLGLVDYFERRIYGRTFEGSKRFLYKVTRNLRGKARRNTGDSGADLRTTFKVLKKIGVPDSEFWPYDIERFDEEPSEFLYSIAKPVNDLLYFRLNDPICDGAKTWTNLLAFIAAGFPVAFGFSVPSSLTDEPAIAYRGELDSIRGGQAVIAVGYKLDYFGRGQHALLIRSSWGSQWGSNGNGWLPATYLRKHLAKDFWTVISEKWLESGELYRPHLS